MAAHHQAAVSIRASNQAITPADLVRRIEAKGYGSAMLKFGVDDGMMMVSSVHREFGMSRASGGTLYQYVLVLILFTSTVPHSTVPTARRGPDTSPTDPEHHRSTPPPRQARLRLSGLVMPRYAQAVMPGLACCLDDAVNTQHDDNTSYCTP